jgi:phenol hydroxylase P1 protein
MNVEPKRKTFAHIARRFGEDRTASRYEEGMYDLQATDHFHYKPLWGTEHWTYDAGRTQIVMEDWYKLRDPRQFYYGTYTQARANLHQTTDHNFGFVEKRGLLNQLDDQWQSQVENYLIPLRHYEWGANMNACLITDFGFGTAVTSAAIMSAGDRLGIAQIISRIGIALDQGGDQVLKRGKSAWMEASEWQEIRHMMEDSLVIKDWFETYVAQLLAMDGVIYPLVYEHFDNVGQSNGGTAISMLCEFMVDWSREHNRWVDAVIKTAAAESDANRSLLSGWYGAWRDRTVQAARPLATKVMGEEAESALTAIVDQLDSRAAKLGLVL